MEQSSAESSTYAPGPSDRPSHRRRRRFTRTAQGAVAGLVIGALALAGCGDDDSNATPSPTPATPTATAAPEPTPTATPTPPPTATPTPGGEIDFEHTGNLMRDNPGFPAGVWVLSYEAPGAPALSAELEFDDNSECVDDGGPIDCDALEVGMRVTIEGIEQDDETVLVVRLEVTE